MKRVILLTVFSIMLSQLNAKVIFVKQGSNGNGSSWAQALGCLHSALDRAKAGDEIWIAAGKYFTTKDNDQSKSFVIPQGVKIYGGFAGTEADVNQRNLENNFTVLSGEIADKQNAYDNAFTVVTIKHANQSTLLNGLVIEKGNAIGNAGTAEGCGAGIFNDGSNSDSSPIIEKCIFMNNAALEGAAIYNYAANGTCNPIIRDCRFVKNESYLNGGAIYNNGANGVCNPQIIKCLFEENKAVYGAAILNKAEAGGRTAPIVKECDFVGNVATKRGSGVYNETASTGAICEAMTIGCRYEANSSSDGNEIANRISKYDFSSINNTGNSSSGY